MSLFTDRLGTVAASLDASDQRLLSKDIAAFSDSLESAITIDFRGETTFDQEAVRSLVDDFQRRIHFAAGQSFADDLVSSLQGGFAVLGDQKILVPRSYVGSNNAELLGRLPAEQLAQLGASVQASSPAAANRLVTLSQDQQLFATRLQAVAQMPQFGLTALSPQLRPVDGNGDGGNTGGGSSGGGGSGGGQGPVTVDLLKKIDQFLLGLKTAVPTQISWTVGPGICMDSATAHLLVDIVLGAAGPELIKIGTAAIAAGGGIAAGVLAGIAAAGGFATFIVVICAIIFTGWLASCITSRGACIHFPWWAGFGPVPFAR